MTVRNQSFNHYRGLIEQQPSEQLLAKIQQESDDILNPQDKKYLEASYYVRTGSLQKGQMIFMELAQAMPQNAAIIYELARLCHQQNKFDEAIEYYVQLKAIDRRQVESDLQIGNIHLSQNHYPEAIQSYNQGLLKQPEHPLLLTHIAFCLYKQEELEEALKYLNKLNEKHKTAFSYRVEGLIAFEKNELDESSRLLTESIKLDDKNYLTWSELSLTEKERGKDENAYKSISMAMKLNKNNIDYFLYRASYGVVIEHVDHRQDLKTILEGNLSNETHMVAMSLFILYSIKFSDNAAAENLLQYDDLIKSEALKLSEEHRLALENFILNREDLNYERKGTTTKKGAQTQSLSLSTDEAIIKLQNIIIAKVKSYVKTVMAGNSLYKKFFKQQVRMKLWSVVLDQGGHQNPHMHPGGCVSGCYYLKFNRSDNPGNSGNIVFGNPEAQFHMNNKPITREVEVQQDQLVIFPSYYFHNTIPTEDSGKRISIAFDIVPVEENIIPAGDHTAPFNLWD